jgi:mannose-6-phosphate isomerase-like protein (cupin superfamily)
MRGERPHATPSASSSPLRIVFAPRASAHFFNLEYDEDMKLVRPERLPVKAEFSLPHGAAITGLLEFKAGTRLPVEGFSVHAEDEVSFILSGALKAVSGGEPAVLRAGDISFIPANEAHWAEVLEDVRIAYVLIPRA